MNRTRSSLVLAFVLAALSTASVADAGPSRSSTPRADDPVVVPVDTCEDYHDCIDICAEEFSYMVDFCTDNFESRLDVCLELADSAYESCLMECGDRPEGC